MRLELTAVFRAVPEGGYVAFVEELPGANTQGETWMRRERICAKRFNLLLKPIVVWPKKI